MHVSKTFLVKCHISLFFLHNLKMFASICVLTQALYNKLKHTKLIGISFTHERNACAPIFSVPLAILDFFALCFHSSKLTIFFTMDGMFKYHFIR